MKLALDVWYELWERTGSEGGTEPNFQPDEQDDPLRVLPTRGHEGKPSSAA